jgi:hypothetical protein
MGSNAPFATISAAARLLIKSATELVGNEISRAYAIF